MALDRTQCWETRCILPAGFLPMQATPAPSVPASSEYGFTIRYDAVRLLAGVAGQELTLRLADGGAGDPWRKALGSLRQALRPSWAVLDLELLLPSAATQPDAQPVVMLLDILRIGDAWLLDVGWEERQQILARSVQSQPQVHVSPNWTDPEDASEAAGRLGCRGIVAKRLRGRYFPGEQSREWLSLRRQESAELVIVGWIRGNGVRSGAITSLLVAHRRQGHLAYAGQVTAGLPRGGTGTLSIELEALQAAACPLPAEPRLRQTPSWVRPVLTCRIRCQGWNDDGTMKSPALVAIGGRVSGQGDR